MKRAKNNINKTAGRARVRSDIKLGDTVMVIAGGSGRKRENKGKTGKLVRFVGRDRVIIEGLNMVTRHRRPSGPDKLGGKTPMESPIHVSNVMYYAEKLKQPVSLCFQKLEDGKKVRGYKDPKSGEFVQVD